MPLTEKGGPARHDRSVRYIPDKEKRYLTDDQARHVHKKVETDKVINLETMKQEIEDDKMTRNRINEKDTTETNPYQMVILNKVYKDDIKTEQIIYWSILSNLIKYIGRSLDMAPSLTVKPLDYRQHRRLLLYNILLPINWYSGIENFQGYFIILFHQISRSLHQPFCIASDLLDTSNPHEYADTCY